MQSVAMQHLGEHADDREAQAALWTMPALEALLFALTNDGSVRMRRAAIQAAGSVKVGNRLIGMIPCMTHAYEEHG